jgi:hypothetical protein
MSDRMSIPDDCNYVTCSDCWHNILMKRNLYSPSCKYQGLSDRTSAVLSVDFELVVDQYLSLIGICPICCRCSAPIPIGA